MTLLKLSSILTITLGMFWASSRSSQKSGKIDLIYHAESKAKKWLSTALGRLKEDLKPWTQNTSVFVSVHRVAKTFPEHILPTGVEEIFLKANLALLMGELIDFCTDDSRTARTQLLQVLSTVDGFPALFLDFTHVCELMAPTLRLNTVDAASALLIQYYIDIYDNVTDKEDLDSFAHLRQMFEVDDGPQQTSASRPHRVLLKSKGPEIVAALSKLIRTKSSPGDNLTPLQKRDPRTRVAEQLASWAQETHKLLDSVTASEGGIARLLDNLKQASTIRTVKSVHDGDNTATSTQRTVRTDNVGTMNSHTVEIEHNLSDQLVSPPTSDRRTQREDTLPLSESDESPVVLQAGAEDLPESSCAGILVTAREQVLSTEEEQLMKSMTPHAESVTADSKGDSHQGDLFRDLHTINRGFAPAASMIEQIHQESGVLTVHEASQTSGTVLTQVAGRKKGKQHATDDYEAINHQAKSSDMDDKVGLSKRLRAKTSEGKKETIDHDLQAEERSRKRSRLDSSGVATQRTKRRVPLSMSRRKVDISTRKAGDPVYLPR